MVCDCELSHVCTTKQARTKNDDDERDRDRGKTDIDTRVLTPGCLGCGCLGKVIKVGVWVGVSRHPKDTPEILGCLGCFAILLCSVSLSSYYGILLMS
jgi:hypothetical protein